MMESQSSAVERVVALVSALLASDQEAHLQAEPAEHEERRHRELAGESLRPHPPRRGTGAPCTLEREKQEVLLEQAPRRRRGSSESKTKMTVTSLVIGFGFTANANRNPEVTYFYTINRCKSFL
jgi:hypothetical protein